MIKYFSILFLSILCHGMERPSKINEIKEAVSHQPGQIVPDEILKFAKFHQNNPRNLKCGDTVVFKLTGAHQRHIERHTQEKPNSNIFIIEISNDPAAKLVYGHVIAEEVKFGNHSYQIRYHKPNVQCTLDDLHEFTQWVTIDEIGIIPHDFEN